METTAIVAWAVFGAVVLASAFERQSRTAIVLTGAFLMALLNPERALAHLDGQVLALALGMMVLAGALKQTGLSQYLAIRSAKLARGEPVAILLLYGVLTLVFAALWGPVATMFLMVPVSLLVAVELDVSPLPFVITEAVAAGLGGATTLVGDPASMLVGAAFGQDAGMFSLALLPLVSPVAAVFFVAVALLFRRQLRVTHERKARILDFDAKRSLPNRATLVPVLSVAVLTWVGFAVGPWFHVPAALVAAGGAAVLMLVLGRQDPGRFWADVDWNTLGWLGGLLVLVGGLGDSGALAPLVAWLASAVQAHPLLTELGVLGAAAVVAALLDNVTAVAVLAPLLQLVVSATPTPVPLWAVLVLGAALGGAATLTGALPQGTAAALAAKSGYKVGFWTYTRPGLLLGLVGLAAACGVLTMLSLA